MATERINVAAVPTQLPTELYRNLQSAGDTVQPFQGVLDRYKDGLLQVPVHQRDATAWEHEKRGKYVERLRQSLTGSHPPGSFVTYQVVDNDRGASPAFLNDGYQRLTTLLELEATPAIYGMDIQGVRELLQQQISVQHRHYDSHVIAMRDFQLINNGTRLTSHELCVGFLKYMDGYDRKWKPLLDDVEAAIQRSAIRLLKQKKLKRDEEHKLHRHTWALFHRFLTEEKRAVHYQDVAARDVERYVDGETAIEQRLVRELQGRDYEAVQRVCERFRSFVDEETAMLEQAVRQILGDGYALAPTLHRWLLDLAVWRRTTRTSREEHKRFVDCLLANTKGRSRWPTEDGDVTIGLCHLGLLPRLSELAEMPNFCESRRRPRGQLLKAGYDNSHVEPFVTHGDGPTVPEPAPLNRARGAKTLPVDEL